MSSWLVLGFGLGLAAAGCDGGSSVAADAAPDTIQLPTEAGPCGGDVMFTGAVVDLESSVTAFRGVFEARLTVQGVPAQTTTTAPNGRFELCAPVDRDAALFDVDAPGDYLDGFALIERAAMSGFRPLELRLVTDARATSFYAAHGLVFDRDRAHVLVFVAGDRVPHALDRAHDAMHAANDDDGDGTLTWEAGDAGRYLLFPNVDVASPTARLTSELGDPHDVPIAAGKVTVVATYFAFI